MVLIIVDLIKYPTSINHGIPLNQLNKSHNVQQRYVGLYV